MPQAIGVDGDEALIVQTIQLPCQASIGDRQLGGDFVEGPGASQPDEDLRE
jgi:hypothetical protein